MKIRIALTQLVKCEVGNEMCDIDLVDFRSEKLFHGKNQQILWHYSSPVERSNTQNINVTRYLDLSISNRIYLECNQIHIE